MKPLLLAALLLVAACGSYQFPGSPASGNGTVSGQVVITPCAPVESPDNPCKGTPMQGVELDFIQTNTTHAATTDSSGHYTIELPAGTYKVSPKNFMRIVSGPRNVTVNPGDSVVADYMIDSGIRVPIANS